MATIESRVRKFLSGASIGFLEQVKNSGLHNITNDFSKTKKSYDLAPKIAGKIILEKWRKDEAEIKAEERKEWTQAQ